MTNKDRLLCLFESEGLDISPFISQKESSIFCNQDEKEYLKKADKDISKVLKNKGKTYEDLCNVEAVVNKSDSKINDRYANNPFLFNYKNGFLRDQRLCDFKVLINGEKTELSSIASSGGQNKKDIITQIKNDWSKENKEYISQRRKLTMEQVDKDYYNKKSRLKVSKSNAITYFINLLVIIFLSALIMGAFPKLSEHFECTLFRTVNNGLVFVLIFYIIYTIFDFISSNAKRDKVLDRISSKYNRMLDCNETFVMNMSAKQMVSKSKINLLTNFRSKSDQIDNYYLCKKGNAPFIIRYNLIKSHSDFNNFMAFVCLILACGFVPAIVFSICVYVLKKIFSI